MRWCYRLTKRAKALDGAQPGLPMKKGRAGTMTHDYKRNGVTTLFAALVAAKAKSVTQMQAGEVIGECMPRHRAKEFLRFLKKIDATVARPLDVHVVCDNYRTHKTKEVQAWLAKHPRFKMHYTPTSSSWLNLVERLFAEITRQQIRRGAFKSVADLEAAIAFGTPRGTSSQSPSHGPPGSMPSSKRSLTPERSWPTHSAVPNQ